MCDEEHRDDEENSDKEEDRPGDAEDRHRPMDEDRPDEEAHANILRHSAFQWSCREEAKAVSLTLAEKHPWYHWVVGVRWHWSDKANDQAWDRE
jgi:hypothetical protein